MNDVISVPRAAFNIEQPWALPEGVGTVPLLRSVDGGQPRLRTEVAVYRDGEAITFLFFAEDDAIRATHVAHDAPLYEEDVVEVFLAPRERSEYFEIELNPLGTLFDARIESPDGERRTMRTDLAWRCDGVLAAVEKRYREGVLEASSFLLRLPFASLGVEVPASNTEWSGNLFRIDRHEAGDEFSAWCPTLRRPADFHVTAAFGRLRFE